jgi:hypothetical protein
MMANAEKLANENVTVEMIRQQAFLEGLMAIVGFKQAKHDLKLMGVNSGLLARTVKRYSPEAGKVKIEGDQEDEEDEPARPVVRIKPSSTFKKVARWMYLPELKADPYLL